MGKSNLKCETNIVNHSNSTKSVNSYNTSFLWTGIEVRTSQKPKYKSLHFFTSPLGRLTTLNNHRQVARIFSF
jgi:hypothetical protein